MHQLNRRTPTTNGEAFGQYFTKSEVVHRCLVQLGSLPKYDLVVEPSAGNGTFLEAIEPENKVGLDIDPQHRSVIQADWFAYEVSDEYARVLIVGSPPYGRYHELPAAFIRRAMSLENVCTIAFIHAECVPQAYSATHYPAGLAHRINTGSRL